MITVNSLNRSILLRPCQLSYSFTRIHSWVWFSIVILHLGYFSLNIQRKLLKVIRMQSHNNVYLSQKAFSGWIKVQSPCYITFQNKIKTLNKFCMNILHTPIDQLHLFNYLYFYNCSSNIFIKKLILLLSLLQNLFWRFSRLQNVYWSTITVVNSYWKGNEDLRKSFILHAPHDQSREREYHFACNTRMRQAS